MHDLSSHFARSTEAVYLEREGRFVWLNPPAAALWGGSPEQFAGRLVSDFLVLPAAALASDGTVVERTLRRIDGTSLAVRCAAGSLDSEAGAALLVFVDDGRVRGNSAERALADAIGEGVIGVDENHRVVFANPTACALLDRDEDAMLGRKLDDVVAAVSAEGLNLTDATCPAWCQVAEGQTFQTDSWTFLRADGCRFPVSLAITPLSGDGPERGAVMTFQDTTRRKLAESALTEHAARLQQANAELAAARDAAQRFRLALDASQDAMLLIDRPSMRFLDANESAYRQMGYTREELLAMGPHDIKPEYDRKRLGNLFDAIIASPAGSGTLETTHRRKDGSTFPVEVNLRALTLAGRPALIAVVRDVTLRKQGEEMLRRHITELARANSELARTNAELDQFTYVASHDLQEPLRKVMAFSDWLRRDMGENLPESADKDLRFICDATRRMQNLVQDLLTLSRTGRISMSRATFPLAAAVEAALDTLSVNIAESGATVVTDPLPEVNGDLSLIIQLFQNLVGNALKYVEEGVRPQVFIHCGEEDGVQVFGVRDHGIGLKPEYAEQIFEPFKRLHGRGRYEGTGIGLAICRKIVQRHGGHIWVESNEGEGAHFRFTLGEAGDTPKLQS